MLLQENARIAVAVRLQLAGKYSCILSYSSVCAPAFSFTIELQTQRGNRVDARLLYICVFLALRAAAAGGGRC